MPYVEDKETVFLTCAVNSYKVSYITWKMSGQCGGMPPIKFRVAFYGGVKIDIEARSQHKAREIALDIAELFKGSV